MSFFGPPETDPWWKHWLWAIDFITYDLTLPIRERYWKYKYKKRNKVH
jgi:hypothetical protein